MWSTAVATVESSQGLFTVESRNPGIAFLSGVNNNLLVFAKIYENRRWLNICLNHFIAFKAEICVCNDRCLERGPVCPAFFRADGASYCYRAAL